MSQPSARRHRLGALHHAVERDLASDARARRLLPGEDLDSDLLEDIEHWLAVYAELLRAQRTVLADVEARLGWPAGGEAGDVLILRRSVTRLERRLQFWSRRRRELGPSA